MMRIRFFALLLLVFSLTAAPARASTALISTGISAAGWLVSVSIVAISCIDSEIEDDGRSWWSCVLLGATTSPTLIMLGTTLDVHQKSVQAYRAEAAEYLALGGRPPALLKQVMDEIREKLLLQGLNASDEEIAYTVLLAADQAPRAQ